MFLQISLLLQTNWGYFMVSIERADQFFETAKECFVRGRYEVTGFNAGQSALWEELAHQHAKFRTR